MPRTSSLPAAAGTACCWRGRARRWRAHCYGTRETRGFTRDTTSTSTRPLSDTAPHWHCLRGDTRLVGTARALLRSLPRRPSHSCTGESEDALCTTPGRERNTHIESHFTGRGTPSRRRYRATAPGVVIASSSPAHPREDGRGSDGRTGDRAGSGRSFGGRRCRERMMSRREIRRGARLLRTRDLDDDHENNALIVR